MRFPRPVRGGPAIALAVVTILGLLLAVGFARGWHYQLADAVGRGTQTAAGPTASGGDDHDHNGHEHNGHEHDGHEHNGHEHDGREHDGHEHDGREHDGHEQESHEEHDDANSLELSKPARRSLDLKTGEVAVGSFERRISVPGTIVPWPGRTHVTIAAPLTGMVTSVHIARGETVTSGAPLYTLRLTHQDLVRVQSEFLQSLGRADVERREMARLNEVAESGAIARRSLLERQYEFERLQAELGAMRESLLLHGLAESQVERIEKERKLIREVTLFAPVMHGDRSLHDDVLEGGEARFSSPTEEEHAASHIEMEFVVTELAAERGQAVATGDPLTVLADYEMLLAEGHAFQQDAEALVEAARTDAPVQAVLESGGQTKRVIDALQIAYIASEVQTASRTLPFYVPLENEPIRQEHRNGRQFTSWRFKPGQRLQLRVPVDRVDNVIVLPVEAVATEGAESYVFVENGDRFERRPVEIVLRDQLSVAIAHDGQLRPGDSVAMSDAHQLQMALKNRAGGGTDPHAGHKH